MATPKTQHKYDTIIIEATEKLKAATKIKEYIPFFFCAIILFMTYLCLSSVIAVIPQPSWHVILASFVLLVGTLTAYYLYYQGVKKEEDKSLNG